MERDPYKYFRLEARDLLTQFSKGTLELEKDGNGNNQIQKLLRLAHTLKGASRVVKLIDISERAHAIEDLLAPFKESRGEVPRACIDALLKHIDELEGLLSALSAPSASASPSKPAQTASAGGTTPVQEEQYRTVRADMAEMDALLDGVVETHTLLNGLRNAPRKIGEGQQLVTLLLAQLAHRSIRGNSQLSAALDRARATADDLRKLLAGLERTLEGSVDQMDRELHQLRDAAEQLRLVSAGALFSALERLARDVANSQGKRVTFDTAGGDIHLDAYVLSTVQGALVQIIRNAVAHGIEPEHERRATGKPLSGRISLSVSRRAGQIVFRCEDDGRGVDVETVRRKAQERGLLPANAAPLSGDALAAILLKGGISTFGSVTDAAGRGVGLDVVRTAVEQLGGKVDLQTAFGKGTVFELIVPLSVTSLQGLMVEAAGDTLTIPLDAVQACLRVDAHEITSTSTGTSILYEGEAVPFISLSRALFGAHAPTRAAWSTVMVANGANVAAIGVDRLRGTARTVVRPLSSRVPANVMIAGASLDAEGNPQLVLDPRGLVMEAPRLTLGEAGAAISQKPILVIDDSLTTRMLEQSILESAGYAVDVATSGEEGLERARAKNYALILVDVEMPGMDGFTFVEHIRADPSLHETPIIVVTSRNAPEDLQRGRDVRASGYVVKGEFNQTKLLSMIKPLVANHGEV